MKLTRTDFAKLRWHALAAVVLIGLSVALVSFFERSTARSLQQFQQANARFNQAETRLRDVRNEEMEFRERSALFSRLESEGLIGPEKRLDWTEILRDIQRKLRLPGMSYEFSPQAPLENGNAGDFVYYTSAMKVHLTLVHEEDLLNFLRSLQQSAKALIIVRACNVSRLNAGDGAAKSLAQLMADCDLEWITLHRPTGKTGTP